MTYWFSCVSMCYRSSLSEASCCQILIRALQIVKASFEWIPTWLFLYVISVTRVLLNVSLSKYNELMIMFLTPMIRNKKGMFIIPKYLECHQWQVPHPIYSNICYMYFLFHLIHHQSGSGFIMPFYSIFIIKLNFPSH